MASLILAPDRQPEASGGKTGSGRTVPTGPRVEALAVSPTQWVWAAPLGVPAHVPYSKASWSGKLFFIGQGVRVCLCVGGGGGICVWDACVWCSWGVHPLAESSPFVFLPKSSRKDILLCQEPRYEVISPLQWSSESSPGQAWVSQEGPIGCESLAQGRRAGDPSLKALGAHMEVGGPSPVPSEGDCVL